MCNIMHRPEGVQQLPRAPPSYPQHTADDHGGEEEEGTEGPVFCLNYNSRGSAVDHILSWRA